MPNWLGDCIIALPAVNGLRRALPGAELLVMVRAPMAGLFEMVAVDTVLPFDFGAGLRSVGARMSFARRLHGMHIDAALILPNSFDSALVPWLARVPVRVGRPANGRRFMLTHPVERPAHSTMRHQAEWYVRLVEKWIGGPIDARYDVRLNVPAAAAASVAARTREWDAPVVALNPGATNSVAKCWMSDRFARVAVRAHETHGAHVVIIGGPGDVARCGEVAAHIERLSPSSASWCEDLAGKTTLHDLAAWLQACRCLVTNDTGAMHVSAAVGTPVVAIFGPTSGAATGPLGEGHRLVVSRVDCGPCDERTCRTDHRCMTSITAERVWAEVDALLGGAAAGA